MREEVLGMSASERDRASLARHHVEEDLSQRDASERLGEPIQIDGSPHAWFEGRGPRCTLIVFIDDATGRLTALRFAPAESTRAYLEALRDHV